MDKSGNTFDNSIGSSSISDFLRFSSNFAVIKLLLDHVPLRYFTEKTFR